MQYFCCLYFFEGRDVVQEEPQDVRPVPAGGEVPHPSPGRDRRTGAQRRSHHAQKLGHQGRGMGLLV